MFLSRIPIKEIWLAQQQLLPFGTKSATLLNVAVHFFFFLILNWTKNASKFSLFSFCWAPLLLANKQLICEDVYKHWIVMAYIVGGHAGAYWNQNFSFVRRVWRPGACRYVDLLSFFPPPIVLSILKQNNSNLRVFVFGSSFFFSYFEDTHATWE